jgi:hypothetical protein
MIFSLYPLAHIAQHTTTWEEQQKMDQLRKVYHRAVQIPLVNVERLWTELEAFENGLNRIVVRTSPQSAFVKIGLTRYDIG